MSPFHHPHQLIEFGTYQKTKEVHGLDQTCYILIAKEIDPANITINEGQGYALVSENDNLADINLSILAHSILTDYF